MRVDCRDKQGKGRHYRPFLDGLELFNCFMADEETGAALVFATDEHGRRFAYYPDPTRIRQPNEPLPDPYNECVVEVHGHIELREVP